MRLLSTIRVLVILFLEGPLQQESGHLKIKIVVIPHTTLLSLTYSTSEAFKITRQIYCLKRARELAWLFNEAAFH